MRALTLIGFPLTVFGLLDLLIFTNTNFLKSTITIGSFTFTFMDFSTLAVMITAFTTFLGIAVISGLTGLGSGLNAVSVETILKAGFLMVVYGAIAVPSAYLIMQFGFLGNMLLVFLTIMYFIGTVLSVRGGG